VTLFKAAGDIFLISRDAAHTINAACSDNVFGLDGKTDSVWRAWLEALVDFLSVFSIIK
jgi:hypothetical protein